MQFAAICHYTAGSYLADLCHIAYAVVEARDLAVVPAGDLHCGLVALHLANLVELVHLIANLDEPRKGKAHGTASNC